MARTPSPAMLAAITAGVVVAAVGAGIILQPTGERADPAAKGPAVNIAVVDPIEPVLEAGSVMDVGDLADGYIPGSGSPMVGRSVVVAQSRDYPPQRVEAREIEPVRESPVQPPYDSERREPQRRWSSAAVAPGPDYAEARRNQLERMEAQRRLEAQRRFEGQQRLEAQQRFEARQRLEDRRREEEFRNRSTYREPPVIDRPRERQWYSSDGRPLPAPDPRY